MNAQAILALTEVFARTELTGSLVTVLTDTVELDAEVLLGKYFHKTVSSYHVFYSCFS